MILTTTRRVRAYLAAPPASTQPVFNASWVDISSTYVTTPDSGGGSLNGTTPQEIVGVAPASSKRQLQQVAIFNSDASPVAVTVEIYDGSTQRTWFQASLDPGWTLEWEHGATWHVYDDMGIVQGTGGGGTPGEPIILTVEDIDSVPTYTDITTIRFDQTDGFVITQPAAGTARIDMVQPPFPDEEARLLSLWGWLNRGGGL